MTHDNVGSKIDIISNSGIFKGYMKLKNINDYLFWIIDGNLMVLSLDKETEKIYLSKYLVNFNKKNEL